MNTRMAMAVGSLMCGLCAMTLSADERRFSYSYEPETLPKGAMEFEQWLSLRTQRTQAVGQGNFNLWEIRSALEYGVSDRYAVELYLNTKVESSRDPASGVSSTRSRFNGVSIENRYMVFNPATHAVGLTLYLEPRFSGGEAEVEEKIILGQRHGNWKWALNLTHATEWSEGLHKTEGELEASFGIARDLGKRWSVGLELRDHNELPKYEQWENTALFLGPTLSYRRERWWGVLSVLPQIYGANFLGNPDGNHHLDLEGHERLNMRLVIGIDF